MVSHSLKSMRSQPLTVMYWRGEQPADFPDSIFFTKGGKILQVALRSNLYSVFVSVLMLFATFLGANMNVDCALFYDTVVRAYIFNMKHHTCFG